MTYKYPTPDKAYIKILAEFAKYPDGANYKDVSMTLFHKPGNLIDEFKTLVFDGLIKFHRKDGRKHLHVLTKTGHELLDYANQFSAVCDFIDFAKKFQTFPEFMIEAVLRGKQNYTTQKFYDDVIIKLKTSYVAPSYHLNYVDDLAVLRHIENKLKKISWFDEYRTEMNKSAVAN